MRAVKVLSAVAEIFPLMKTGGLGDVAGALPLALREHDVEMVSLVPGYPSVMAALEGAEEIFVADDLFGGKARVLAGRAAGLDLLAIEAPHLFDRSGNPYQGPDGRDWPDNAFRFGALGWIAAQFGLGAVPALQPDIVHCHDWHAGLAPAYLGYAGGTRARTLVTIHNLAYTGQFPADLLGPLRLPPESFQIEGVEFYGSIGFLKAGLQFADRITTVSPTFAAEMQTPTQGFGLDGLLRSRSHILSEIINGIDTKVWNPLSDKRIPARFGRTTLAKREANKTELQGRFGLEIDPGRLLFGIVSRLVWQKGMDIVADAAPALLESGAQLVVLGTGEPELEHRFAALAAAHLGRIGSIIGYDEDLAHLVQAGADVILVPSRFEPCGLTQLCALRYGALPFAAKVGGLADTIIDLDEAASGKEPTGFHFTPVTQAAFEQGVLRAGALWRDKKQWRRMQLNGMRTDVSWQGPGAAYARLYSDLLATNK